MEVREGALFGFLGPNGAGKTTTMRIILDLIRPDSGQITWNGIPVREVARRSFGYLPEERGLYPRMEVEAQLLFLARLSGLSKQDALRALDEWLERFQISANRHKKIEELSKGNQQKVQFLAAMLHDPTILIMDEPFSGLDPVNAAVLKEADDARHQRDAVLVADDDGPAALHVGGETAGGAEVDANNVGSAHGTSNKKPRRRAGD